MQSSLIAVAAIFCAVPRASTGALDGFSGQGTVESISGEARVSEEYRNAPHPS
jgi:hypothetical protein